ncbi:MAG: hypothetical protein KAU02_02660 [Tenericutes bacterium]|nr:hypothetical protein [Mycoplasmatota bacterium]
MRTTRKPFKFYFYIFIFSVVIVAGYSLYMIYSEGKSVSDVYNLWFMPPIFTGFYYGSDLLIDKFTNRKKKINYEANFLAEISKKMNEGKVFLVEEFRRLQNNYKFQEDLKRAYQIYTNGESEVFTIAKLEKKYRKDTVEFKAMKYVVEYLKENQKNTESN